MPDESPLIQFHQQLESEITESARDEAGAGSGEFRENVLTDILAEELSASGVLESPVVCHYDGGRAAGSMKVNGYGVPEEDSRLDLFITLYCGPADQVTTINAADVDTAFRKVERFLGKALGGLHADLDPAGNQYLMAEHIQRLKDQVDRVCFYLFTNARLAQRKEKERKPDVFGLAATYEIWDLERFRRLRESGASYEALVVDFRTQPAGGLPCVVLGKDQAGFQTCVTVFPGQLLCELYNEYGARLLELNVRSYLQARGKVNAGILKTLRESPQDFMAYNNGITVVAEEIVFGKLTDGSKGILELRGMQVVNGGQTTASIHRAAKEFEADLSRVFVQGKVTVVDPGRFQ
ncbi:MAG: AIPR family protein, partial [Chloroflexi bacterium]|nr:AIPR family protein [Chloroflexota bacterium]